MRDTGRLEAFSDGVLAIAITLLVLDLRVPARADLHGASLSRALAHEWPAFAAYVTSFLIIGIMWINHHALFRLIGRIDRTVLFFNLILLMFVAAVPFTTALLSEYLTAGRNSSVAAVWYSLTMFGNAIAFSLIYGWAAWHPAVLADGVDPAAMRGSLPRFSLGLVAYLATAAVALVSAVACLACHFALALYYSFEQTGARSVASR